MTNEKRIEVLEEIRKMLKIIMNDVRENTNIEASQALDMHIPLESIVRLAKWTARDIENRTKIEWKTGNYMR